MRVSEIRVKRIRVNQGLGVEFIVTSHNSVWNLQFELGWQKMAY